MCIRDRLWNVKENKYTVNTNYGLNFLISTNCDYTSLIVDQPSVFKSLIWYQVAINLLRELAINPDSRINRNEANLTKNQLLYEIDGDSQGYKSNNNSISFKLKSAFKGVQLDVSGIDKICLPCRKRSARIKEIGPSW